MPPTTFNEPSMKSSWRSGDKPYVSIEVERPNKHQIKEVNYEGSSKNVNSIDESKTKDGKINHVPFLGFNLYRLSTTAQFFILSSGIFFFYLLYGITMEQIFRLPG